MSHEQGEQIKEIYTHFGLATYLAQALVDGVEHCSSYLALIPDQESSQVLTVEVDASANPSLAQLLNQLNTLVPQANDLVSALAEAEAKRIWLANRFYRDRTAEFQTTGGRESMLDELKNAQELFMNTDTQLQKKVQGLMLKHQVSQEMLNQAYQGEISLAHNDTGVT